MQDFVDVLKRTLFVLVAVGLGVLAGIGFLNALNMWRPGIQQQQQQQQQVNIEQQSQQQQQSGALKNTVQDLKRQNRTLRKKLTKKTEQLKKQEKRTRELVRKLNEKLDESEVESKGDIVTVNIPEHILFDEASARLFTDEIEVLQKISDTIKEYPEREIRVQGHTDTYPMKVEAPYESNWELSAHRAVNVLKYLVYAQGIDRTRIGAVAFGQFRPVTQKMGEDAQAKNRRVEIVLYPDKYVD